MKPVLRVVIEERMSNFIARVAVIVFGLVFLLACPFVSADYRSIPLLVALCLLYYLPRYCARVARRQLAYRSLSILMPVWHRVFFALGGLLLLSTLFEIVSVWYFSVLLFMFAMGLGYMHAVWHGSYSDAHQVKLNRYSEEFSAFDSVLGVILSIAGRFPICGLMRDMVSISSTGEKAGRVLERCGGIQRDAQHFNPAK